MSEPEREMEKLREAVRDLGYEVFKTLGIIRLARRLGMTPKPWVLERELRDEWKPK
jgi:hypothetical protein